MHARCVRLNSLRSCVHKRKTHERSHSEVNVAVVFSEGANCKNCPGLDQLITGIGYGAAPGTEMTRVIGGVGPSVNSTIPTTATCWGFGLNTLPQKATSSLLRPVYSGGIVALTTSRWTTDASDWPVPFFLSRDWRLSAEPQDNRGAKAVSLCTRQNGRTLSLI